VPAPTRPSALGAGRAEGEQPSDDFPTWLAVDDDPLF
jgi:hypothetical protein